MKRMIPHINLKRAAIGIVASLFSAVLLTASVARGQTCSVYPIALSMQSLSNAVPGTILTNIWNGSQPGNFGWLSWTGDPDEPTLINSLTQPGDSYAFINPDDATDHQLTAGDWVSGKPGVSNGKHVRASLDAIEGFTIMVPVWDQARGQGENTAYHIVGFAQVIIIDYHLPSRNMITAEFVGFVACGAPIS
jgi:hypothetical protein